MSYLDIVFDGPPGPTPGRFVEVEDSSGASVKIGNWVHRADNLWALRIPAPIRDISDSREELKEAVEDAVKAANGLSNDEEIEALGGALDTALNILNPIFESHNLAPVVRDYDFGGTELPDG